MSKKKVKVPGPKISIVEVKKLKELINTKAKGDTNIPNDLERRFPEILQRINLNKIDLPYNSSPSTFLNILKGGQTNYFLSDFTTLITFFVFDALEDSTTNKYGYSIQDFQKLYRIFVLIVYLITGSILINIIHF